MDRAVPVVVCLRTAGRTASAPTIAVGTYTPSTTSPFVVPVTMIGAVELGTFTFDLADDPTAYAIAAACDAFSGA